MAASADMIAKLRRMIVESGSTTYTDGDLAGYIEQYPIPDSFGYQPFLTSGAGVTIGSALWTPTYDLNRAAADLWDEKAAALACNYNMTADGATLNRSEAYEHACQRARHFRSRRNMGTITLRPEPRANVDAVAGSDDLVELEGDA